jgi:hypothetical protein
MASRRYVKRPRTDDEKEQELLERLARRQAQRDEEKAVRAEKERLKAIWAQPLPEREVGPSLFQAGLCGGVEHIPTDVWNQLILPSLSIGDLFALARVSWRMHTVSRPALRKRSKEKLRSEDPLALIAFRLYKDHFFNQKDANKIFHLSVARLKKLPVHKKRNMNLYSGPSLVHAVLDLGRAPETMIRWDNGFGGRWWMNPPGIGANQDRAYAGIKKRPKAKKSNPDYGYEHGFRRWRRRW